MCAWIKWHVSSHDLHMIASWCQDVPFWYQHDKRSDELCLFQTCSQKDDHMISDSRSPQLITKDTASDIKNAWMRHDSNLYSRWTWSNQHLYTIRKTETERVMLTWPGACLSLICTVRNLENIVRISVHTGGGDLDEWQDVKLDAHGCEQIDAPSTWSYDDCKIFLLYEACMRYNNTSDPDSMHVVAHTVYKIRLRKPGMLFTCAKDTGTMHNTSIMQKWHVPISVQDVQYVWHCDDTVPHADADQKQMTECAVGGRTYIKTSLTNKHGSLHWKFLNSRNHFQSLRGQYVLQDCMWRWFMSATRNCRSDSVPMKQLCEGVDSAYSLWWFCSMRLLAWELQDNTSGQASLSHVHALLMKFHTSSRQHDERTSSTMVLKLNTMYFTCIWEEDMLQLNCDPEIASLIKLIPPKKTTSKIPKVHHSCPWTWCLVYHKCDKSCQRHWNSARHHIGPQKSNMQGTKLTYELTGLTWAHVCIIIRHNK